MWTRDVQDPNTTLPYNILVDSTTFKILQPKISEKTAMVAGASIQGSMGDVKLCTSSGN